MNGTVVSAQGWTWGHLGLAALIVALALWQAYRWMIVPIPGRHRATLLALRLLWMLLLVWCLWEPVMERVTREETMHAPDVTVLVDCSRSMSLPDENGRRRWDVVEGLMPGFNRFLDESLAAAPARLALGAGLREWRAADGPPVPDERESRIWEGVRDAVRQRGDPATANLLFLFTDGADTGSGTLRDVLPALRNRGVRIYPVRIDEGIGAPPIARIEHIDAPAGVRSHERFAVQADVRIRRSSPTEFTARLICDGQPLDERRLAAASDGTLHVEFPVTASEPGLHDYAVELREAGADAVVARRRRKVSVRDMREQRVLYVMGSLDWEYQYVARALEDNASLEMDAVVRKTPRRYDWMVAGQPQRSGGIELLQEALQAAPERYAVVVLANLNPRQLTVPLQESLLRMVRDAGGGILFMNGNPVQAAEFRGSLLEELLPVSFAAAEQAAIPDASDEVMRRILKGERNFEESFAARQAFLEPLGMREALRLTPAGRDSPVWQNAGTRQPLGDPPATFLGCALVSGVKPAAEVLAVHPARTMPGAADGGPLPLFVCQTVGAGRSAYLGVDALWPWRMETAAADRDYDVFWQQLLTWLGATSSLAPVAVDITPRPLEAGKPATVTLRSSQPCDDVGLWLDTGAGQEAKIPVTWNRDRTEATGQFMPPGEADFTVLARGREGVLAHRSGFVGLADVELEHSGSNLADLETLARETGGRVLQPSELSGLKEALRSWKQTITRKDIRPLWHSPWIFAAMLAAYGGELLLRRRWRLT